MDPKAGRRETKIIRRDQVPDYKSARALSPAQRLEKLLSQSENLTNRLRAELRQMRSDERRDD